MACESFSVHFYFFFSCLPVDDASALPSESAGFIISVPRIYLHKQKKQKKREKRSIFFASNLDEDTVDIFPVF